MHQHNAVLPLSGIPDGKYKVIIVLQPALSDTDRKIPKADFGKGKVVYMSLQFNAPLDDFNDYQ